jgi:hypothetical protein
MTANERKLRKLAQDDPVMHQLFGAYDAGYFTSWEAFLVNSVITMAEVKNSLHKHIEEELFRQPSPPIVFNVTPEQKAALLTNLKR